MAVCVYDNPATMRRECWQNGTLLCHYSASYLIGLEFGTKPIPGNQFFFGANVGKWQSGQVIGNSDALKL